MKLLHSLLFILFPIYLSCEDNKTDEDDKNEDLKSAEDHLYFCQYIEKPFADFSKTWGSLYRDVKEKIASNL